MFQPQHHYKLGLNNQEFILNTAAIRVCDSQCITSRDNIT